MQMQSHHRTGMHRRDEEDHEQEDYDEYEEEGSEEEEEDEKEEPVISKEEQEFLRLREELKEKFRQKLKKQTVSAFGNQSLSHDKRRTPTNDNFGSFFGPSKPVIASRVIDERRSIQETQHMVSRAPSSSSSIKGSTSSSSGLKSHVHPQKSRVVNEVKKKAQTLKDMRDYSFLLSDDADLPAKEEPQRPASRNPAPKPGQAPSKSRPPMGTKPTSNGHQLKNSTSKNMQSQAKVAQAKGAAISKPRQVLADPKRSSGSNVSNGSGRPLGHKPLPLKPNVQARINSQPPPRVSNDPRLNKRPSAVAPNSSTQRNHSEQKRPSGGVDRVKTVSRQPLPSSRPAPKHQQISHRDVREDRLKKRPVKRPFEEDDEEDAIGLIRKMFKYNPNKYAGMDEDDSDMEADFSTIQKEELRSLKIARREDEEQLRLIEEEERRERMRKKQKLSRG